MLHKLVLLIILSYEEITSVPFDNVLLQGLKTEAPDTSLMEGKEWKSDRSGSCKAITSRQAVTIEGCEMRYVRNRICFGRCNSVYIPQLFGNFKHCKACIPSRWIRKTISFRCKPTNETDLGFQFRTLKIIKDCKCQDVECDRKWERWRLNKE